MSQPQDLIEYKRSRFRTKLPGNRFYTASHYWLSEQSEGVWRVGFTKFVIRMLGEPVELEFEKKVGDPVKLGEIVGWIDSFKASSDLFSVVAGVFDGGNTALEKDLHLLKRRPYEAGWLFQIKGEPDPAIVDVNGYCSILDDAIDNFN
jgi:glycine cleavage system H protein